MQSEEDDPEESRHSVFRRIREEINLKERFKYFVVSVRRERQGFPEFIGLHFQ